MKRLIQLTVTIWACLATYCLAGEKPVPTPAADAGWMSKVGVAAIGAVRHVDPVREAKWGAGAEGRFTFNKYVTGYARAIAYKQDEWGGSTIDEAGVGGEATFWRYKALSLAAKGGANFDFETHSWGLGIGLRPDLALGRGWSLFGSAERRAWLKQQRADIFTGFGICKDF